MLRKKSKQQKKKQKHLFKDFQNEELLERIKEKGYKSFEELTYKDFQKEMNQINKAYYEIMTQGDKTGQPF